MTGWRSISACFTGALHMTPELITSSSEDRS